MNMWEMTVAFYIEDMWMAFHIKIISSRDWRPPIPSDMGLLWHRARNPLSKEPEMFPWQKRIVVPNCRSGDVWWRRIVDNVSVLQEWMRVHAIHQFSRFHLLEMATTVRQKGRDFDNISIYRSRVRNLAI